MVMSAVKDAYEKLIAAGELRPDEDQKRAVEVLERLARDLQVERKAGLWSRLTRVRPAKVRGIYMWGGVGRGKSMLMDLAFESIEIRPKRRVHFHEFMLEVHERLRVERTHQRGDPIPPVARALAAEARLLAFDEMVINNSADAMILSRLFGQLLEAGVTVITTSNRPPRDLYKGGLNRELFLPFIDLIEAELDVVPLNGPTDYRLERLGGMPTWYVPNGPEATRALSEAFFRLTD
jgi:cell division protein ZapE